MSDLATKILTAKGTSLFSLGQAGFIVKSSSGSLLAIDLYLTNCVERFEGHKGFKRLLPQLLLPSEVSFDVVVCSHAHFDHFDIDAVPEMLNKGSRLLCSTNCEKYVQPLLLEYYQEQISYVKPKDRIVVGDFVISFVNCDHGANAPDAVGVVVRVDGKTIYEVGDSCFRPEVADEIPQPLDVLISPINGLCGNMDSEETSTLASILKPSVTIPCHYGMFASHGGDLKRFYDTMTEKRLSFLIMQQGEQYIL